MKTNFLRSWVALAFVVFAFSACDKNPFEGIGPVDANQTAKDSRANSEVVWNGISDRTVAVTIAEVKSARTDASGAKITSNAHSADFPGLYFIWDAKQKDNGYLKVAAWVFDKYESFVLTSKESKTYWDFPIAVQENQQLTTDGCYVFFVPKVYNNKNINMVFISELRETPPVDDPQNYLITILSGQEFGVPVTSVHADGEPYSAKWDGGIVRADYGFDAIAEAGFRTPALWAWDIANSLETGVTGSTVEFNYDFFVGGKMITDARLIFAADNAIAVWINDVLVGKTKATAFNDDGTMTVLNGAYGATGWSEVCEIDYASLTAVLKSGNNTLKIIARNAANGNVDPQPDPYNSDGNKNTYDTANNPGGVLFAFMVYSQTL